MTGTGRLRLWPESRRLLQTGPIEGQSFRIVPGGTVSKAEVSSLIRVTLSSPTRSRRSNEYVGGLRTSNQQTEPL